MDIMKIVINADDFGESLNRNRAIDEAFRQGLISSIGVIVTGQYLQNALDYVEAGDYFEHVHLHLNISSNLLDEDSNDRPFTQKMKNDPFFCIDGFFKPYHGLRTRWTSCFKWKEVYDEIVAQYVKFIEITKGRGDTSHIDFHLWYNLTWPVSIAMRFFLRRYKIKSARLIGMHQMGRKRYRFFSRISSYYGLNVFPATNIDYYLSKKELFDDIDLVELYCHPDYRNGVWLDNSPSYLKHERLPLPVQLQKLNDSGPFQLFSWNNVFE